LTECWASGLLRPGHHSTHQKLRDGEKESQPKARVSQNRGEETLNVENNTTVKKNQARLKRTWGSGNKKVTNGGGHTAGQRLKPKKQKPKELQRKGSEPT